MVAPSPQIIKRKKRNNKSISQSVVRNFHSGPQILISTVACSSDPGVREDMLGVGKTKKYI
jgi:hypothetical protein